MNESSKEEFGTKDSKEFLKLGFVSVKVFKEAKENDGKIDMNDMGLLIQLMPVIGPAFDGAGNIIKEIKDYSPEEIKELLEYSKDEMGEVLTEEKLLARIEAVYSWCVSTAGLFKVF